MSITSYKTDDSTLELSSKCKVNNAFLLSFVEMWERYSYYGMRALLVLFLTSHLGFKDERAYAIYSIFAAIGYAGPVLAGWLADKIFGFRIMVIVGGSIMVLGHIAMAIIPLNDNLMYIGLGGIAIGTGMFKGNISNLLGSLYKQGDPERDRGFTLFYVGINVGGFLSPIVCGYVAKIYGWHYGFGIAGIGMTIGLVTFLYIQNLLGDKGLAPNPHFIKKKIFANLNPVNLLVIGSFFAICLVTVMIYFSEQLEYFLYGFGALTFLYYLVIMFNATDQERRRLLALFIFVLFFMSFFAIEMQIGSLINLFTERNVVHTVFGLDVPASVSQSINPFVIIIFGLILGFAVKVDIKYSVVKFALGLSGMALCFLVLYFGCMNANSEGEVPYIYLFAGVGMMALGELLISPFVLSQATVLSPEKYKGFVMGFVMMSLAFSNLAGIIIGRYMKVDSVDGHVDKLNSLEVYKSGFWVIFEFNAIFVLVFLIFAKFLHNVIMEANRASNTISRI